LVSVVVSVSSVHGTLRIHRRDRQECMGECVGGQSGGWRLHAVGEMRGETEGKKNVWRGRAGGMGE
jgi:hypothetical protein